MSIKDNFSPKLISVIPEKGLAAIAVNQDIILTFNEAVQLGTGSISISNSAGDTRTIPVSSSEISVSGQKITLNLAEDLRTNSRYTVKIDSTAIQDLSGNKYVGIKNTTTLYFDTVDTLAPSLVKSSPLASAPSVATNSNIVLTLSENIKMGSGNITIISGNDSRAFAITDPQVKISGATLTINPSVDFNIASTYKVHLDAGAIKDLAPVSNSSTAIDLSFTTQATGDKQAPVLQSYVGKGVVSDNLQLTFQENIKIGKGSFTLVNSTDSKDKIVISATDKSQVSVANNVLTIDPKENLKSETTYLLTAPKGILTDVAKNAFAGIVTKVPFKFDTHDTTAPELKISGEKATATNIPIVYTFTASEAINGFTVDDITVTGGTKGEFKAIAGTNNYTLSVTPTANSTTPVTVNVAAGKFTDLVNNANLATATSTQEIDTVAPTITITDDKPGVANSPILYTFTLSEASNTFTLDDITVTGGTKAATLTTVSSTVYTLSVTPDANSTKSITVDVAAGKFADAVGNNNVVATQSVQEVNTVSPSVTITDDKSAVTNSAILYTFTLSAPSSNFSIDDITVTGGKSAATLTTVSSTVYTLGVTPDANSTTPVTVNVAADKFTDTSGRGNIAATQNSQEVDTIAPTIKIEDNQPNVATGGVILYTFTLSEPSSNFSIDDITMTGGTKAATLTTVSPTVYTLSVTPNDNSILPITVDVAASKFNDAVGNNNIAALQSIQQVKTTPTLGKAIDGYLAGATVTVGTYTTTTDASGNFKLPAGLKGEVVVSGGTDLTTGKVFKGVLKAPEGSSTVTPLTTVQQGFIASGQTPTEAQASVAKAFGFTNNVDLANYDPIATLINASPADKAQATALMANAAKIANFLVTAGETLKGAGGDKVTAASAGDAILKSLVNSVSSSGSTGVIDLGNASLLTTVLTDSAKEVAKTVTGITDNFAANITAVAAKVASVIKDATDNIAAVVATGGSSDTLLTNMGNVSEGASAKLQDIVKTPPVVPVTPPPDATPADTKPPAVTITSSTAAIKAGETATITATFSEAPTGFVVGDLVSSAGAFSNFAVNGVNPLVYTATFTPTAGSPATSAGITIASGSYTDAAGNAGGAGTTPTLAMDMIAPTVTISSSTAAIKAGETATITATFSEAPTGFVVGDLVSSAGAFSNFAVNGVNPLVYTATFTPTAGSPATSAGITIASGSYTDAAGNAGGAGTTPTLAMDMIAPTVTISSSTAAIKAGETATITATFSEAPTGFVVGDLVSSAGAFSNFAVNGVNPLVYTATFTPTAGSPATSAGITIASGSYTDAAGNAGGAGTAPTLAMDMISPVLSSSTPSDNATGVSLSSNIVLNFNESVRLGTTGNIVITNAVDINDTRTISVTDTTQGKVSVLGSTLTINPANNLKAGYDYNVKFASGVVTDLAGNAFAGISDATTLNFTTVTNGTTASPVTEQSTGNDIINGNQGSVMDLNPKTFDASAGADQYVFSAIRTGTPLSLPAANITINHFDAATGDKLVFDVVTPASGLSDINTLYSVSDYGDGHVELIVNDDGNVQIIGLINLGNTNTIKNVTDLSAFLGTNAIAFI